MINSEHELISNKNLPSWQADADIRVLIVGDELTANSKEKNFPGFDLMVFRCLEKLTNKKVEVMNLSEDGVGNDFIVRKLSLALSKSPPDLVLVKFSPRGRREYLSISNEYLRFDPQKRIGASTRVVRELIDHLSFLSNPEYERFDFIRNALWIKAIIGDLPWWAYTDCREERSWLEPYLNETTMVTTLTETDRAEMKIADRSQLQLALANHFCQKIVASLRPDSNELP